jgi:HEPN domain-containing protein
MASCAALGTAQEVFFIANKVSSPRTHNLIELINLCSKLDGSFSSFMGKMATLNQFYAPTRYPDAIVGMTPKGMPNKELARKALGYAHDVVSFCKGKIKEDQ